MDFIQLLAKMKTLDTQVNECDGMTTAPTAQPQDHQTPPPSMTVNLNAHGMSNIESMMKLFQKVNPDMMPKEPAPMPTMSPPPNIMSISPDSKPINKLLPDLSDEPLGPDSMDLPLGRDLEKKEKGESWDNEPDEQEYDVDKIVFSGNDLHKQKKTYPKVSGGDNPMQRFSESDQEVRDYVRDVKTRIQSGEVDPSDIESEFFNAMALYGMDDDQIMSTWDRILNKPQSKLSKTSASDARDNLQDLIRLTKDADSDEEDDTDDITRLRSQAKTGKIGVDQTGYGIGLESVEDDLQSQIREELKQRLSQLKLK